MAKISRYVFFLASFFLFTFLAPHANAAGVLRVHPSNPRYLTDNSGNAIYLTGSHTWNQWQDYFDFNAYLDFLDSYNHNYIRLWSGDYGVGSSPSPYLRTGPGTAVDGGPKVDLDQLNQAYFNRIRSNVIDAGNRGKYVGINLLTAMNKAADWDYSFFKSSNNIQGINGDTNGDGIGFESTDLSIPQITAYQEAVVRKMVDTLNDLDNVLYEIVNEGDNSSMAWQYHFINYLKNYQAGKPKQHPVGMSATLDWQGGSFANNNSALFNSPADWIAPGGSSYIDNMPPASGAKVILLDSDHIASVGPDWVWKSFMRGLQPNLMDWYNTGSPPQHWYTAAQQDVMRKYMGYTLNYSKKINLAAMTPRGDLTSSGYALASPGSEYLIYSPAGGSLSATLTSGNYTYEWFDSATGSVAGSGNVTGSGSNQAMPSQPFSGEGVLYLKSGGTTPTPTPNITPTPTTSCPNSWNSSLAVPANFGAAFNWFTSEKELLVNVLCSGNSNTVNVGNGSSVQYIYKTGHVWQNNQWTAFNYSGQNMDAEGNWFVGSANHSLGTLDLTQKQSVVAYICEWTGVWKCGCSDNSCSTNHWNLQQFNQ